MTAFRVYCNPGAGGCTSPDWPDPSEAIQTYNNF